MSNTAIVMEKGINILLENLGVLDYEFNKKAVEYDKNNPINK